MSRPRLAAAALMLLILVSACTEERVDPKPSPSPKVSASQQTDDPIQPTSEPTTIETATPTGVPAGKVVRVLSSLAKVNGKRLSGGDLLYAGSRMTTDDKGRAIFTVGKVLEDCQIDDKTELKVALSARNPVDLVEGKIICRTKPGEKEHEILAGQSIAEFLDPIFLIEVNDLQTGIRVDYGFVQVRKSAGAGTLLVGPGAGVEVGAGDLPDRAETFDAKNLDEFDAPAVARMRKGLPKDPKGLPEVGASEALSRIAKRDGLNAAIDQSAPRASAGFGREVVRLLANLWGVDPVVEARDHQDASWMLQQGVLDAFISPNPVDGATGITLFEEGGRLWSVWVRPDASYQAALEKSLVTILNNGDYGKAYLGAFGLVPIYEPVRSLVYRTPQESGSPRWSEPLGAADPPPQAQIGTISVSTAKPNYSGPCPHEFAFTGRIEVLSPGTVDYEFIDTFFPEGEFSAGPQPRSPGTLVAKEAGTMEVKSLLKVAEDGSGWMNLKIPSKGLLSSKAPYEVDCVDLI